MQLPLSYKHLEAFLMVARCQSFTEASRELNKAQPALSKQIKTLEEDLGVQLLIRGQNKVSLTKAGQKLYQVTSPIFMELFHRISDFRNDQNELNGEIVFACLQEVGDRIFIHLVNDFIKENPQIKFKIKYLKTNEIVDGVKNGKIDVGIVAQEIIQENVRTYKIYKEKIVLTCAKKFFNKDAIDKGIKFLPIVKYREMDPLLAYYQKKFHPRINLQSLDCLAEVNSQVSMKTLLLQHPAIAVIPELSIRDELKSGKLVDISKKDLFGELFLIH